ncbi:MAG: hypothetical protein WEE36_00590 [Acidimicrobiia bacterium]
MTLGVDSRRRVFAAMAVFAGVELLVALINLTPLIDRYAVGRVLDMNGEANAVVWLSSTLLLGIGFLAGLAAHLDRGADRVRWAIIACFFALLSLDETASLHELAGELASRVAEVEWLPSLYLWVIVVAPFAAVFAVWMIRWIWGELGPGSTEARMAFVAVALWLAVPLLEAVDPSLGGPRALVVVEESLEITGEILMLGALSLHLIARGLSIEATTRR